MSAPHASMLQLKSAYNEPADTHSRPSATTACMLCAHLVQHAGLGHKRLPQRLAAPQIHLLGSQQLQLRKIASKAHSQAAVGPYRAGCLLASMLSAGSATPQAMLPTHSAAVAAAAACNPAQQLLTSPRYSTRYTLLLAPEPICHSLPSGRLR